MTDNRNTIMHSHEYIEELNRMLNAASNIPLDQLGNLFVKSEETYRVSRAYKPEWWEVWKNATPDKYRTREVTKYSLKGVSVTEIMDSLYEYERCLKTSKLNFPNCNAGTTYIDEFRTVREGFITCFSKYDENETSDSKELSGRSQELLNVVRKVIFMCQVGMDAFDISQSHVKEGSKRLTIYLAKHDGLSGYINRLEAFNSLYSEVCFLFNISSEESYIEPVRVEYGSSLIDILGNEKVITFVTTALSVFAGYLYKKFTAEGKASLLPMSTDRIDKLLGMTEKMEALGMDTKEQKELIKKVSLKLVKYADKILDEQYSIEINGEKRLVKNSPKLIEKDHDEEK